MYIWPWFSPPTCPLCKRGKMFFFSPPHLSLDGWIGSQPFTLTIRLWVGVSNPLFHVVCLVCTQTTISRPKSVKTNNHLEKEGLQGVRARCAQKSARRGVMSVVSHCMLTLNWMVTFVGPNVIPTIHKWLMKVLHKKWPHCSHYNIEAYTDSLWCQLHI